MRSRKFLFQSAVFLSFLFFVFVSNSVAGLVPASLGSVEIVGDLADPLTPGSFKVQVDYAVFDGTDASDPLGLTSEFQVVFELMHLGDGGELPALNFGRFTVFSDEYLSAVSVDQGIGGVAPVYINTADAGRVQYHFVDGLYQPTFAPGDQSWMLVLSFDPGDLPQEDVIIEVDGADYNVHGDTMITLIPEPCTLMLLGFGTLFGFRKRRA